MPRRQGRCAKVPWVAALARWDMWRHAARTFSLILRCFSGRCGRIVVGPVKTRLSPWGRRRTHFACATAQPQPDLRGRDHPPDSLHHPRSHRAHSLLIHAGYGTAHSSNNIVANMPYKHEKAYPGEHAPRAIAARRSLFVSCRMDRCSSRLLLSWLRRACCCRIDARASAACARVHT